MRVRLPTTVFWQNSLFPQRPLTSREAISAAVVVKKLDDHTRQPVATPNGVNNKPASKRGNPFRKPIALLSPSPDRDPTIDVRSPESNCKTQNPMFRLLPSAGKNFLSALATVPTSSPRYHRSCAEKVGRPFAGDLWVLPDWYFESSGSHACP